MIVCWGFFLTFSFFYFLKLLINLKLCSCLLFKEERKGKGRENIIVFSSFFKEEKSKEKENKVDFSSKCGRKGKEGNVRIKKIKQD